MAKKKIEIVVDLDSDKVEITSDRVLTLTQQVRILKQEIEKAGPGPKQDLLIAKFNEINDELDKTKLKSKEFLGALGTLPGGIGNVAGSLDNAVNQLRDFSSFSLKDIKTQIGGLGDDFKKIGKNLFELTGLSKVYAAANNLLGKSFFGVALGEKAAAAGAVTLTAALAALGIPLLIAGITIVVDLYKQWANGAKEAAERQKEANDMAVKGANAGYQAVLKFFKSSEETEIKRAKLAGKTEEEIEGIRKRYADLRIEEAKKNLKKLQAIQGAETTDAAQAVADFEDEKTNLELDAQLRRKENRDKDRKDKKDKEKIATEQEKKDKKDAITQINKAEEDAYLLTVEARDKELFLQGKKFNDLMVLAKKYGLDTAGIIEANRIEELEINKKYDKIQDENIKKTLQKNGEFLKYLSELKNSSDLKRVQDEINILDRLNKIFVGDLDADNERYRLKREKLDEAEKIELKATENNLIERNKILQKYADLRKGVDEEQLNNTIESERARVAIRQKALDDIISIVGAETNVGRAALVAKQILMARELFMEAKRTITFSAQAAARSTVAVAEGTAQTAKVGFPQNIPLLIGYAAQAFGILSAIRAAVGTANSTAGQSGGGGNAGNSALSLGNNYEEGGMINGPRHAAGGVMINAEGGEAVMTRGAVTMFGPLLSQLNQMGGGTSFNSGITGQANYDSPKGSEPTIMKTYVVSQEMTSEAEKSARLKDLSTL